jgi:hypothetical protein
VPSGAPFRRVRSRILVDNPVASSQTGTVTARISGLHGLLLVGIGMAYYPSSRKAPAGGYGTNAFRLFQVDENESGEAIALGTATPLNGASGQAAPDKWDLTTTIPAVDLVFAYAGMGAADVGRWEAIVTAYPAIDMCQELFDQLASRLDIGILGNAVVLS